jgi:hypothetical protein
MGQDNRDREMRSFIAVFVLSLLAASSADAAAGKAQLIYKVDHASVSIEGRKMIVNASGAVKTGGWENPKLHIKEVRAPEADTLVIEFVATPPSKDAVVIQALLPVTATLTAPLAPYGTTLVKIVAESNSVTVPYK